MRRNLLQLLVLPVVPRELTPQTVRVTTPLLVETRMIQILMPPQMVQVRRLLRRRLQPRLQRQVARRLQQKSGFVMLNAPVRRRQLRPPQLRNSLLSRHPLQGPSSLNHYHHPRQVERRLRQYLARQRPQEHRLTLPSVELAVGSQDSSIPTTSLVLLVKRRQPVATTPN